MTAAARKYSALGALVAASLCACGAATAQPSSDLPGATFAAPRWSVALAIGALEPDLDSFEVFYGDDEMDSWAASFAYAFRPWLEAGAEVGHASADGVGILAGQGVPGGAVDYTLLPAHAFVKVRGLFNPRQLFVPYVGLGLATAYYKEKIDGQAERTGTSELGAGVRVGLEVYLNRLDADTHGGYGGGPVKQSYVYLEWQRFSTKQSGSELGGDELRLGLRLGFGRDTTPAGRR